MSRKREAPVVARNSEKKLEKLAEICQSSFWPVIAHACVGWYYTNFWFSIFPFFFWYSAEVKRNIKLGRSRRSVRSDFNLLITLQPCHAHTFHMVIIHGFKSLYIFLYIWVLPNEFLLHSYNFLYRSKWYPHNYNVF